MTHSTEIEINAIDHHIAEQGHFNLLDWLLAQNLLHYSDYEDWRYGRMDYIDQRIVSQELDLGKLLDDCARHCDALNLQYEPQDYYQWGGGPRRALHASKDKTRNEQLTQRWIHPRDTPQLDLFMDNSALISENALRDALAARDFDQAERQIQKLIELNPEHGQLGAYQDLINYGRHMLAHAHIDDEALAAEMQGLENEVGPLALETLAAGARDYLVYAWRRLADNLAMRTFDAQNPEMHASYVLMQIPDWPSVHRVLIDDPDLYRQPKLLERLAIACDALRQSAEALLLWCLLMERHPSYAQTAIEKQVQQPVYRLWESFWAFDESWDRDYFPAFVLMQNPGLIHRLDEFTSLESVSTRAMIDLLESHLAGDDEIAARKQVQGISPELLNAYIEIRRPV